jgi:hypothetical protein
MTYGHIKQRVYDQLCMPEQEVNRLGYASKIPRLLNEALFRIAHSILPNLREYVVKINHDKLPAKVTMPPDFISFADEQAAYLNGQPFTLTKFVGISGIILDGNETQMNTSGVLEYHIFYNAEYPRILDKATSYTKVELTNDKVDADNYNTVELPIASFDIPDIAAMAIPHYIAGQLLVLDDKVRSIEEMNEFETLISVTSTYRHERTREYHSSKGWY